MTKSRSHAGRQICIALAAILGLTVQFLSPVSAKGQWFFKQKFHFTPPAPPGGSDPNVRAFGAVGDGVTDDQSAFDQAIAAAGPGGVVSVPPGNYAHSSTIVLNNVRLIGAGASSILIATSYKKGAVELQGTSSVVQNIVVTYKGSFSPHSCKCPDTNGESSGIWINGANNFGVLNTSVTNTPGNGIDVSNSQFGTIQNDVITNSGSDGIFIWDCMTVYVVSNVIQNSGCRELEVAYNTTGSTDLVIILNQLQANSSRRTGGALLSGLTGSFFDANGIIYGHILIVGGPGGSKNGVGPVTNLEVGGNSIDMSGRSWVASLLVQDCNNPVNPADLDNIRLMSNTITKSQTEGMFIYGSDILAQGNVIANAGTDGLDIASSNNINCTSNTISNVYGFGIRVNAFSGDENVHVTSNNLTNCCKGPKFLCLDVIRVDNNGTFGSLDVVNNVYNGPANNAKFFTDVKVTSPTPTISGNTQTFAPPLPNFPTGP